MLVNIIWDSKQRWVHCPQTKSVLNYAANEERGWIREDNSWYYIRGTSFFRKQKGHPYIEGFPLVFLGIGEDGKPC